MYITSKYFQFTGCLSEVTGGWFAPAQSRRVRHRKWKKIELLLVSKSFLLQGFFL